MLEAKRNSVGERDSCEWRTGTTVWLFRGRFELRLRLAEIRYGGASRVGARSGMVGKLCALAGVVVECWIQKANC